MDTPKYNIFRLYKEKLTLLLDVAQTINEDHTVDDLMQEFERVLRTDLGIGRILLLLLDDGQWRTMLASGVDAETLSGIDAARDLEGFRSITSLALEANENLRHFDYAIPLYHNYKLVSFVLIGDDCLTEGVSSSIKNLKFTQIISNIIVVFIQNKKMQQRLLHQEYLRRELELAKSIQVGLVPADSALYHTHSVHFKSLYHPHQEVGGDYYDVIRLSRWSVGFCMADVSGKGISAALLMSNFQALVRGTFSSTISMKKLVKKLNSRVCNNVSNGKFITLFIARYNALTGVLTYVNCGHLPALVYNPRYDQLFELEQGCIGLGMLEKIPGIEVGRIVLSRGTRLITYTDGLVEVNQGHHVSSSTQRLKDILRVNDSISAVMNQTELLAEEDRKKGYTFDDVSVLGLEVKRNGFLAY